MTFPNIHTLTIEGEETQTFDTDEEMRAVLIPQLRANPGLKYKSKEIGFCPDCGEEKEYVSMYYCKSCSFRNSDAVKASRKIIRSAKRHGNPVVSVWDTEDYVEGNERDLLEAVHSVDTSRLVFESGATVLVIAGNESESDCICDYSMSVEAIVKDANLKEEEY